MNLHCYELILFSGKSRNSPFKRLIDLLALSYLVTENELKSLRGAYMAF